MFETFDHTADLGLRVAAPDENALFVEAARGLMSLLVENPESIVPVELMELDIAGVETDYLLFDWLSELLYRYETRKFLGATFELTRDAGGLHARVQGERVDRARHRLAHEVKAITYHGLTVKQTNGAWEAELIVDI